MNIKLICLGNETLGLNEDGDMFKACYVSLNIRKGIHIGARFTFDSTTDRIHISKYLDTKDLKES